VKIEVTCRTKYYEYWIEISAFIIRITRTLIETKWTLNLNVN